MGTAVEYSHVSYAYPGAASPAVEDVTLRVEEGQRLGVLGPNGGGKSTLLRLTLGILRPSAGEIRIFGVPPEEARRRRMIGYVPQRNEAELAFPLTAGQVVRMSAALGNPAWRGLDDAQREASRRALDVVGALAFEGVSIGELSGGQLQRVMIARALAGSPRLLLLDEPTVGIDPAGQQQFAELLTRLHEQMRLTVIVVSHDLRTVAAGCDRIACLSRTLQSHVAPEGLTPGVLAEVCRHDVAAIFGELHVDAHRAAACNDPSHTHHH